MKKLLNIAAVCSLLLSSISASFADTAGPVNTSSSSSTSNSSSNSSAVPFMLPNYWGDSRIKNPSTASQQSSGSSQQQNSRGGNSGGGGSSMGMLAPMMMVPMLMMGRGAPIKGLMKRNPKKNDDDQKEEKKRKKKQEQQAMQEDNGQAPVFAQQPMSPISRQTFDLQNGAPGQSQLDQTRMSVSGVVQDEAPQAPGQDF